MRRGTWDCETGLIRPGLPCPPPVCAQWGYCDEGVPHIAVTQEIYESAKRWLLDPSIQMWGVHIAFDMGVLALWFPDLKPLIKAAYEAGRICDNGALEKIAWIGRYSTVQRYGLGALSDYYHLPHGDKSKEADAVRTSYGPLLGQPLSAYSAAQIEYICYDAMAWKLTERQWERYIESGKVKLADVQELSRSLYWLTRTSDNGLRTDAEYLADLAAVTTTELERLRDLAQAPTGMNEQEELAIEACNSLLTSIPVDTKDKAAKAARKLATNTLEGMRLVRLRCSKRKNGNRAPVLNRERVRQWVRLAYDGRPPMTVAAKNRKSLKPFKPQIQTGKAILEQSEHPMLQLFAKYGLWSAVDNKDIPMLARGAIVPIHTRFGIADTYRSTSSNPNIQNQRANALVASDGRLLEVRKAFVPREGYCFLNGDWGGIENITLAQRCVDLKLGHHLADILNSGISLHDLVGAVIHGVSLAEAQALKAANDTYYIHGPRQGAKITNFGAPVGMGPASLKVNAKIAHNVDMTIDQARSYLAAWRRANPDGARYLEWCGRLPKDPWGHSVQIPGTTILRRGAPFCAAANTGFQGLAAAIARRVGWHIYWATQDPASPLYGCRLVNFIHDEFMLECPIGQQTIAALELRRLMIVHAIPFVPALAPAMSVAINCADRWTKDAPDWNQQKHPELQIFHAAA